MEQVEKVRPVPVEVPWYYTALILLLLYALEVAAVARAAAYAEYLREVYTDLAFQDISRCYRAEQCKRREAARAKAAKQGKKARKAKAY